MRSTSLQPLVQQPSTSVPLLPAAWSASTPAASFLIQPNAATGLQQQRTGSNLSHLPLARNVYNLFDIDGMPSGKFANLSIQDMTIQAMLLMIYAPETYMAFKSEKHPWETLGRNALSWTFRLGLMVFTKNSKFSVNSWFLDAGMQDKNLAKVKESKTRGEFASHFWHNHVQTPIQAKFGLDGDFLNEVLRPSGLQMKEKDRHEVKWAGYKVNQVDSVEIMEQRYKLNSLGHLFEEKALGVIDGKLEHTAAKEVLVKKADVQLNVLARDISPDNTINEAAHNVMSGLFSKLKKAPPEQTQTLHQEAAADFAKLFGMYHGHEPLEAEKVSHTFNRMVQEALLENPEQAQTLAAKKVSTWLKQANEGWRQALEQPFKQVLEEIGNTFEQTVAEGKQLKPLNVGKQPIAKLAKENWASLMRMTEQEGGLQKMEGKLAPLLEPLMQLTRRSTMTRGFLDRRNVFVGVQIAFMTALNAVIIGQLMMVLVFNTFAKLDKDFDPTRFKNKKKLYKEEQQKKAEANSVAPLKIGAGSQQGSQVASLNSAGHLPTSSAALSVSNVSNKKATQVPLTPQPLVSFAPTATVGSSPFLPPFLPAFAAPKASLATATLAP